MGASTYSGAIHNFNFDHLGINLENKQWITLSGTGDLHWTNQTVVSNAKLRVDSAYMEIVKRSVPRLSEDVIVSHPKKDGYSNATRQKIKYKIDVETDLGNNFHFNGIGLECRLAGLIRLQSLTGGIPHATGAINTVDGVFDAFGKSIVVERGMINFQGVIENPTLNVRAIRKDLPVEPGVEITGTIRTPNVRLVSDPEMSESEKLSWLVLGQPSNSVSDSSVLLAAASVIFGNESGGAIRQLKRELGLDVGIRTGQIGDSAKQISSNHVTGTTYSDNPTASQILSVGKRLTTNTVLAYEQALGKTDNIVKLTVNLSRHLSLVGRAGSDNALDLFYTLYFGKIK